MGRRVRKTLNIDAAKLTRAKKYLGLDTETEVIDSGRVSEAQTSAMYAVELFVGRHVVTTNALRHGRSRMAQARLDSREGRHSRRLALPPGGGSR